MENTKCKYCDSVTGSSLSQTCEHCGALAMVVGGHQLHETAAVQYDNSGGQIAKAAGGAGRTLVWSFPAKEGEYVIQCRLCGEIHTAEYNSFGPDAGIKGDFCPCLRRVCKGVVDVNDKLIYIVIDGKKLGGGFLRSLKPRDKVLIDRGEVDGPQYEDAEVAEIIKEDGEFKISHPVKVVDWWMDMEDEKSCFSLHSEGVTWKRK